MVIALTLAMNVVHNGRIPSPLSNGVDDIFLLKEDAATGQVLWARGVPNYGYDKANAIAIDNNNAVYITGDFDGHLQFDTTTLLTTGGSDFFIAKFSECTSPPSLNPINGLSAVCSGQQVVYSVPPSNYDSYTWNLPPGWSGSSGTHTITATAGGISANVSVWANNQCGSSMATPQILGVTVNPLPTVTLSTANDTVCNNATVNLLTGTPMGGTYSGTGVTANNFNASSTSAGWHDVYYTYTDANSCVNHDTAQIFVRTPPSVSITVAQDTVCNTDGAVQLSGTPQGGTFSGGGVSGNNFFPTVVGNGNQQVAYNYTDVYGCTTTAVAIILVRNCTGIGDPSTELHTAAELKLWPNPAAEFLVVSSKWEVKRVEVWDVMGRMLISKSEVENQKNLTLPLSTGEGTTTLDVSGLAPGLYFIKAIDNTGNARAAKFVKE